MHAKRKLHSSDVLIFLHSLRPLSHNKTETQIVMMMMMVMMDIDDDRPASEVPSMCRGASEVP